MPIRITRPLYSLEVRQKLIEFQTGFFSTFVKWVKFCHQGSEQNKIVRKSNQTSEKIDQLVSLINPIYINHDFKPFALIHSF